jgi:DsbC/DsbD-like thiol-disulfide interchange protein
MILRRLMTMAACGGLFLSVAAPAARADQPAAETREGAAVLRLLSAKGSGIAGTDAAIEIALDPGWKTYWKTPGPVGLAPQIDWSGSKNLRSATVSWPAPHRFSEGDAESAGYAGTVMLPIRAVPLDPSEPVSLHVSMQFGLCSTVCVPADAKLALDLAGTASLDALTRTRLQGFARRVPAPQILGGDGDLAISAARREDDGSLRIRLRYPVDAEHVDLFADDPDGVTTRLPQLASEPRNGEAVYRLQLRDRELPDALNLVAVAGARAIGVMLPLDGSVGSP